MGMVRQHLFLGCWFCIDSLLCFHIWMVGLENISMEKRRAKRVLFFMDLSNNHRNYDHLNLWNAID